MQEHSKHPQTDVIENDLIAEHNFCEASFNGMTEHARDLERQLAVQRDLSRSLLGALNLVMEANDLAEDAKDFARLMEPSIAVIRSVVQQAKVPA